MAALPFILLTNELHVILPSTLQGGGAPSSLQITKSFFKPHVEEIKHEYYSVRAMGNATAEEWLKGLEGQGKDRKGDASRWEKWEGTNGIQRMRTIEPSEQPWIFKPILAPADLSMNMSWSTQAHVTPSTGPSLISTPNFSSNGGHVMHVPQPIPVAFGKHILISFCRIY
jgi:hypothetical protein